MLSRDPHLLHIAYLPNGGFVLPLLGRLQRSNSPRVRALASKWVDEGLGDLASSLSTKMSMLSLLAGRVTQSTAPLMLDAIRDPNARSALNERKAWVPPDRQRPYHVLLDVDSFIFEFRSAYEILGKFLLRFFDVILDQRIKEREIKERLEAAGVDMAWATELQAHRKIFFHEQAPWLVFHVSDVEHFTPELWILSSADADATDPREVIPFVRLSAIYSGMSESLQHLQDWITKEISELEGRAAEESG